MAFFGNRENAFEFFTKSLLMEYPPFTNPADFYMDTLGIDTNDLENSRSKVKVNTFKLCPILLKTYTFILVVFFLKELL